jgi:hypothetical protein
MSKNNKIVIHSLIDQIADIVVKDDLKLYTKPIKHNDRFQHHKQTFNMDIVWKCFLKNYTL